MIWMLQLQHRQKINNSLFRSIYEYKQIHIHDIHTSQWSCAHTRDFSFKCIWIVNQIKLCGIESSHSTALYNIHITISFIVYSILFTSKLLVYSFLFSVCCRSPPSSSFMLVYYTHTHDSHVLCKTNTLK